MMSDRPVPVERAPVPIDLAVVSALPQEIAAVAEVLGFSEALSAGTFPRLSPRGDTPDRRSAVCVATGAGKTRAARGMALLLERYRPAHILAVGIAGSAADGVDVGDFVVGRRAWYYDVDATALGIAYGTVVPGGAEHYDLHHPERDLVRLRGLIAAVSSGKAGVHLGAVATGDTFVDATALGALPRRWRERIGESAAVDMESAAWAEAVSPYGIPITVVRMISDHVHTGRRLPFRRACARIGEVAARRLLTGSEEHTGDPGE